MSTVYMCVVYETTDILMQAHLLDVFGRCPHWWHRCKLHQCKDQWRNQFTNKINFLQIIIFTRKCFQFEKNLKIRKKSNCLFYFCEKKKSLNKLTYPPPIFEILPKTQPNLSIKFYCICLNLIICNKNDSIVIHKTFYKQKSNK